MRQNQTKMKFSSNKSVCVYVDEHSSGSLTYTHVSIPACTKGTDHKTRTFDLLNCCFQTVCLFPGTGGVW